jgi:hypothetical protein
MKNGKPVITFVSVLIVSLAITLSSQLAWKSNTKTYTNEFAGICNGAADASNIQACGQPQLIGTAKEYKGFPFAYIQVDAQNTETVPSCAGAACSGSPTFSTDKQTHLVASRFIMSWLSWTLFLTVLLLGVKLVKRK